MVKVDIALCTSCGGCINICPVCAIALRAGDDKAIVSAACNDCKICIRACPVNAFSL